MPKWNWVTRDKGTGITDIAVWEGSGKPHLDEEGRWEGGTVYCVDGYLAKDFKKLFGWTPKPGSIQKVKFTETAEKID